MQRVGQTMRAGLRDLRETRVSADKGLPGAPLQLLRAVEENREKRRSRRRRGAHGFTQAEPVNSPPQHRNCHDVKRRAGTCARVGHIARGVADQRELLRSQLSALKPFLPCQLDSANPNLEGERSQKLTFMPAP